MSYVKFESRHLGDARWLDVTPAAFTVHVWALDYCNEQRTDGHISLKVAHRLVCPVEPTEIPDAFKALVELGYWELTDDGYCCPEFTAHGLAAQEQNATQARWADDKRRQRLHSIGNHQLCTPRSRCPVALERAQVDTSTGSPQQGGPESTGNWTTRPDQTRPDPTVREGKGSGRARSTEQRSAGAPRSTAAGTGEDPRLTAQRTVHEFDYDSCPEYDADGDGLPPGVPCPICGLGENDLVHWAHDFSPSSAERELCGECSERQSNPVHHWHLEQQPA